MNALASIDFAPLMGPVARRLLGEPNKALSRPTDLRWGNKGSLSVDLDKGTWYDNEAKLGGGTIALIEREERCDKRGALAWLEREGLIEPAPAQSQAASRSIFYDYADPNGVIAYRVERRGKGHVPPFLQHGPDGRGSFHAGKGCMQGVPRLPYRLPELLAADPARPVFIVEGEKDADRLTAAGLVATTNSEGAGKFRAELAPHFAGRRVVIIPDNDKPGRDHAADVASKLAGHAAIVSSLTLSGLPEKGDVSDWLAGGGSALELENLAEAALFKESAADLLPLLDPSAWAHTDTPAREWKLEEWIPDRQATYLTGPGSAGKSLLSQLLCTCIAIGAPFMGIETRPCAAIYITCEDDPDELHRRQKSICAGLGVSLSALKGKLHLVSLAGAIGNELATFTPEGRMTTSPAWQRLRATILSIGAGFIVLDNVAHLFAGNENIRNQVAAFCALLNSLAQEAGAAVLFLGHPNKAGDAFSGSTAWENQVRSRLFLETPKDADGNVLDPDARVLSRGKANYARNGETVAFRWHKGTFTRDEDLPPDVGAELAATISATRDNSLFLTCLAERTRQRRPVSERSGKNFAPAVFATMPEAKNLPKARLESAMDRLFRNGTIERGFLWRDTAEGRDVHGLRLSATGPEISANASANDPQTRSANDRNQSPQTTVNTHPIPKGISGAAYGAAAPSPERDQPRRHGGLILAPGESVDDPVPGWEDVS